MVKGASTKRSPLPWRAGGKQQPVSPGAAYRAASTNIAPNPLFLNLLPRNPPSQTGDSNLVADKTIDSSHKRWCRSSRVILFCPFPWMAVANLCSRRNRHLRPQSRCQSPRTARRRCLRDRTCPFRKFSSAPAFFFAHSY